MNLTNIYNVICHKHIGGKQVMESITETPGGCQTVCGISHDIQEVFEGYATDGHRTFIRMLQVIEQFLPAYDRPDRSVGRKAYDGSSMVRLRLAEQFFQISTVTPLRNRLPGGRRGGRSAGSSPVFPSEATFSRRYAPHARQRLMERTLGPLVPSHPDWSHRRTP